MNETKQNTLKLVIKDFQGIENLTIEFHQGQFTAIQGASSSCKTAMIRAMEALIKNPKGAAKFIRHGCKQTIVELTIPDYGTVKWTRNKTKAEYYFHDFNNPDKPEEDKTYKNIGRTDIYNVLPNFPLRKFDKNKSLLNFQTEWEHLFPFGMTDQDTFILFEDMFKISETHQVSSLIKNDISILKQEGDAVVTVINKHNEKRHHIKEYNPAKVIQQVQELQSKLARITNTVAEISADLSKGSIIVQYLLKSREIVPYDFSRINVLNELMADFLLAEQLQKITEIEVNTTPVKDFPIEKVTEDLNRCRTIDTLLNINPIQFKPKDLGDISLISLTFPGDKVLELLDKELLLYPIPRTPFEFTYIGINNDYNTGKNIIKEVKEAYKETEELQKEYDILLSSMAKVQTCPVCGNKVDIKCII